MHKASAILDPQSLLILVTHPKLQNYVNKINFFSLVDNQNYDPILSCLAQKEFQKAEILLTYYPDYFKVFYLNNCDKNLDKYNKLALKNIVEYAL